MIIVLFRQATELSLSAREKPTHAPPFSAHSVTLRNDGVGVPHTDGGEGGYVVMPRDNTG